MVSRRSAVLGLTALAFGGGAVTAAAFTSDVTPRGDMRVGLVSALRLIPARENEAHVIVDEDGLVEEIVLDRLDRRAISRFAELVTIENIGNVTYDEIEFEFEVYDPDGRREDIELALQIISGGTELHGGSGNSTLLDDPNEDLGPGDTLTFGLLVNLLPDSGPATIADLPEDIDVTLMITAMQN